jgi:hypothetical protein
MELDPSVQNLTPSQLADLQDNLETVAAIKQQPASFHSDRRVTLQEFSASVECHFSTASRIRSGERMPGRELYNRIVKTYGLDPAEALRYFCGSRVEFGRYLRRTVFKVDDADMARDRQLSSIRHAK